MSDTILINTMYTGDFTNKSIGHEIINLYKTDKGESYLYITPYGTLKKNEYKETKYVLLVDKICNSKTKVLACIEVEALSEDCYPAKSLSQGKIYYSNNKDKNTIKNIEIYKKANKAQLEYIVENKITYGGVLLNQIFNDPWKEYCIYLTFKAKNIFKPKNEIIFEYTKIGNEEKISIEKNKNIINVKFNNIRFGNTSMKTYIENKDKNYNVLKELIEDKNIWQNHNIISKIETDNSEKNNLSFLDIIGKKYDELAYSNMFAFYFDKYPKLFKNFIENLDKNLKNKISVDNIFEVKREEENVDLIIATDKHLFVIENKIKAKIHGEKYDPETKEYTNQLIKYYNYIIKTYGEIYKDKQQIHFYIWKPNYNDITFEKIAKNATNKETKAKIEKYRIVNYADIYKALQNTKITNVENEDYYNEFLNAIYLHSHNDNIVEQDMKRKFQVAISNANKI